MESRVKPEFKPRDPMEHVLKCHPDRYSKIIHRLQLFDLRRNDRDFQIHDTIRYQEYLPDTDTFTGNEGKARIRNVQSDIPGLQADFVALDILFVGVAVKEHGDPGDMNK
jgi:hypothetical protein